MDIRSIAATASPAVPAVAGTPWWIVAAFVVASSGSRWMLGWMDVRDRTRTLQPTMRPADGPVTALVITRRLNQAVRLTTADGTEIIITLRPGNVEGELRLAVEAPRSVVVHRPERDR